MVPSVAPKTSRLRAVFLRPKKESEMPDDLTDEQREKLREMIDTWDTAHRAIKLINFLGRVIRWGLGVGSAIAIIWGTWQEGSPK